MASATITFRDDDDGGVAISVEFDPPLKRGQTMTNAQCVAMQFVDGLSQSGVGSVSKAIGVKPTDTTPRCPECGSTEHGAAQCDNGG